jgi:hypothetical protein
VVASPRAALMVMAVVVTERGETEGEDEAAAGV